MNPFNSFTMEETNLLSIYMTESKEGLIADMKAARSFMSEEIRNLAACTIAKVERMIEVEFAKLAIYPADEV